ncbi:signal transduction histidine kinase [Povalibacter uvarum]|uniref:histidine kinase n=1 Tax=Povalibacter uvarum TaxID=732238 RepID=A0A841HPM7_9GAMM|nr:ATP-binding protein [Povalibacter uvarum]MBB6095117.1 signal transduction histidine kinase [Povalibacter uvarum]
MTWPIVSMVIKMEADIVAVRQRARHLAELLGFVRQEQTRIATAVSEIARNAFSYGRGGRAEFSLHEQTPQKLVIRIVDRGPGVADLAAVLEGRYTSVEGMGVGITGARRLMDEFRIESDGEGTRVELTQYLPRRTTVTREQLESVLTELKRSKPEDPLAALREQNTELLHSLEELRRKQDEATELNRELGDTNRGVVALTAELDDRAEQLRQASEIKSRFLSNMSHEFRTPLNSIMALSRLLMDRVDGDLSDEQARQIGYIRRSAEDLLELVNDLLDLAKVEAGKIDVKADAFTVAELFGGLRGALKPLREGTPVALIFENATELPGLYTDESKVTQVLRNFISNALKFTEQGEIHVSAHYDSAARAMTFAVSDTGIGISAEDRDRIFEEFTQVDSQLQRAVKGTGLGLPLSRKLAELIGGEVWVDSEIGRGSTFYFSVPIELAPRDNAVTERRARKVLLVDDDETFRYVLRQIIAQDAHYAVTEAVDGDQALRIIRDDPPDVIILDLQMPRVSGFSVIEQLPGSFRERIPIIACTSLQLDSQVREKLPASIPVLYKQSISRDRVMSMLRTAMGEGG